MFSLPANDSRLWDVITLAVVLTAAIIMAAVWT